MNHFALLHVKSKVVKSLKPLIQGWKLNRRRIKRMGYGRRGARNGESHGCSDSSNKWRKAWVSSETRSKKHEWLAIRKEQGKKEVSRSRTNKNVQVGRECKS